MALYRVKVPSLSPEGARNRKKNTSPLIFEIIIYRKALKLDIA